LQDLKQFQLVDSHSLFAALDRRICGGVIDAKARNFLAKTPSNTLIRLEMLVRKTQHGCLAGN
jgi:hypothetical protein